MSLGRINLLILLLSCVFITSTSAQDPLKEYRDKIKFLLYLPDDVIPESNKGRISTFSDSMEAQGCSKNSNVIISVPGWLENTRSLGVHTLMSNFQKASRGCVIFVDHSYFTRNIIITAVNRHIHPIASIVAQKIRHIGNYDRIFMFGISMGAHIALDAGYQSSLNGAQINRLELCDTAMLPFYQNPYLLHSTEAAKSVSCIHTSRLGLSDIKCHQNFRLGACGYEQNFGIPLNRMNSHVICQILYNVAFKRDLILKHPNEMRESCVTNETMPIANLYSPACRGVQFGYSANFDRENCRGNFFVETDDVIKDREVIDFLKKKERRFEIEDMTLLLENIWNRFVINQVRGGKSKPFPYRK